MKLSTARDLYLAELKVQAYSATTLRIFEEWLNRFEGLCARRHIHQLAQVTDEHIQAIYQELLWKQGKSGRFLSANTVDLAMRTVRQLFRWAVDQHHLLIDPCRNLVMPRVAPTTQRILTVEEVEAMLAVPDTHTPCGLRDRAVLEALYATGIRRLECHNLNLEDLDLSTQFMQVHHGKGGRSRYLPTGVMLAAVLQRYLDESRPLLCSNKDEPALFLSLNGTRFSIASTYQLVNDTARKAGLGRVGCHALRRACATHMLQNGASEEDVKEFLGHRFFCTLPIYTPIPPADVAEEHRRTHPRSDTPGTP